MYIVLFLDLTFVNSLLTAWGGNWVMLSWTQVGSGSDQPVYACPKPAGLLIVSLTLTQN